MEEQRMLKKVFHKFAYCDISQVHLPLRFHFERARRAAGGFGGSGGWMGEIP